MPENKLVWAMASLVAVTFLVLPNLARPGRLAPGVMASSLVMPALTMPNLSLPTPPLPKAAMVGGARAARPNQAGVLPRTFQAEAMGQNTQAGKTFNVTLTINDYSTDQDRQTLIDAFNKSGSQGLYNALQKMKSKGRIAVTGTLGTDVAYARMIQTPEGNLLRAVAARPINFAEAYNNGRSMDYGISVMELHLNDQPDKSTGTLLPATKVTVNKKTNEVEMEAFQNPWTLTNIRDVTKH